MPFYYNGKLIGGPQGPAGPDGNPIGTVISFMGTSAPKDYLVCDGSEYSISQYPALAAFFQTQFGTKNHFGGDGTTTFAVPDLRNLFLRGYRGEAEEQLSGDVGQRQEATTHNNTGIETRWEAPNLVAYSDADRFLWALNTDSVTPASKGYYFRYTSAFDAVSGEPSQYTSRPVNMAVLYCIKAVESVPAENVYSTEETRIGTWIDGKPLYRKTFPFSIDRTSTADWVTKSISVGKLENADVVKMTGWVKSESNNFIYQVPSSEFVKSSSETYNYSIVPLFNVSNRMLLINANWWRSMFNGCLTVEYTKTIDQEVTEA